MADDPLVDERISFVRRGAMLDRHTQFSLSLLADGGIQPDLAAFVEMLQKNLYELAAQYYRDHEKRIKKKKNRVGASGRAPLPGGSASIAPAGFSGGGRQLSAQGWGVRYDFKLGVFAECRQDLDTALKYYDSAYNGMIGLLQQSQTSGGLFAPGSGGGLGAAPTAPPEIPPGSARWTEARVFVDALSIKMFKLLLYTNHPVSALIQLHKHFVHSREFPEFKCTTPSFDGALPAPTTVAGLGHLVNAPGGGSFEYWAWAANHFRAFGELVEIASSRMQLTLPYPPPGSAANQAQSLLNAVSNTGLNLIAGESAASLFSPFSSVNPVFTVQHAGFYYLVAARCAEERWYKFNKAASSSISRKSLSLYDARMPTRSNSLDALAATQMQQESALELERGVDHALVVIELLTKAYEQFKKSRGSRMTLFLASDIARVYEEGGRFDMALKFFDRIGKTYRREHWFAILASVNRWTIKCAQQLGLHSVVLEALVELLSPKVSPSIQDRQHVLSEIQAILGSGTACPSLPRPAARLHAQIDMDQISGFIQCGVQFKSPQAHVLETVHYQVHLSAAAGFGAQAKSSPVSLPISHVLVKFSNSQFDLCVLPLSSDGTDFSSSAQSDAAAWNDRKVELVLCADSSREPVAQENSQAFWVKRANVAHLPAGKTCVFQGSLCASENQELWIASVHVVLETPLAKLELVFKIPERPLSHAKRRWLHAPDASAVPRWTDLPGRGELSIIRIEQRKPKISARFSFVTPAYLGEYLPVTLELLSSETEPMRVFFTSRLTIGAEPGGPVDQHAQFVLNKSDLEPPVCETRPQRSPSPQHHAAKMEIDVGTIAPQQRLTTEFYVRVPARPGPRMITGILSGLFISSPIEIAVDPETGAWDLSDTRLLSKPNDDAAIVVFESPFDVTAEVQQIGSQALADESPSGMLGGVGSLALDLRRSYEWFMNVCVRMLGRWAIEVEGASLVIPELNNSSSVSLRSVELQRPPDKVDEAARWTRGHVRSYVFRIETGVDVLAGGSKVETGLLAIKWRRLEPSAGEWVCTATDMPRIELPAEILRVYADIPGSITVGVPFDVRYLIQNTTLHLAELVSYVESSDHFVFAGYKQVNFRVLPLSTHTITFRLVPLSSGRCSLPQLKTLKHTDAAMISAAKESSDKSTGSGAAAAAAEAAAAAAREKVFSVLANKLHLQGSKHGELHVFVRPALGW
nr:hypothetical protein HK105_005483 [Polyrhizophydium stewartii]